MRRLTSFPLNLAPALFLAVIVGGGTGCLTEGNFTRKLAKDGCKRTQECDKGAFEEEFTSMNDCIEETEEFLDDTTECFEEVGCEFERDRAVECRKSIRSASCEEYTDGDFADECDEIYDCTGDQQQELAGCFLGG